MYKYLYLLPLTLHKCIDMYYRNIGKMFEVMALVIGLTKIIARIEEMWEACRDEKTRKKWMGKDE